MRACFLGPLMLCATISSDRRDLPGLAIGYAAADNPFCVPVGPDAPGVLYGAGVAIYADTPRGPVHGHGHGGRVPANVSACGFMPATA